MAALISETEEVMMASRAGELQAMMMQARAREACRGGARREG
jgi:hypothetical protein